MADCKERQPRDSPFYLKPVQGRSIKPLPVQSLLNVITN